MAYKILLVDDEDEVRGRIASKMADDADFEIIGSASNGYDALDLLEEMTPDVVITDIKMPFVDGIELTRTIKERYPTVKVGIISGYDDYSYLKEAINLDVVAYLSKPISVENIKGFLQKIKETLDEENEHVQLKEEIVVTQIRNRILKQYLDNDSIIANTEAEKQNILQELGIKVEGQYVVLCMEMLHTKGSVLHIEKKKNQTYLIIEDLISKVFSSYNIVYGKYIISIVEVATAEFLKELDILLNKVIHYLKKYIATDIAIGISSIGKFENLSTLYRESQIGLEAYEITKQNVIHYYDEIEKVEETKSLTIEEVNECRKNMRYMKSSEFMEYVKNLANKIERDATYDYASVMITLSGVFLEYANSIDAAKNIAFDIGTIKSFIENKDIEGFMMLLVGLKAKVKSDVISRETKKSVQIMNDIMRFIEENFSNPDMNMDLVSDKFYISVSYLSTLFKKETETTFNKYLVTKRIEHAKFLLLTTEDKMVTIAEKCGYKDVYYFSHSFKKVTGQSPKGFRKNETV